MPDAAPETVRIIACGALAREITAVVEANALTHVDLTCLPALWHNRPEKIAPALREAVAEARAQGITRIMIGYAECGSRGEIDRLCEEEGLARLPGPHCYAFYTGTQKFLAECGDEITSFYLTDLIARQFDAFITGPLKLDKHPELVPAFFGNYEKLVYLAQTEDAELDERARAAADFLGLAYERRFTGYGDLEPWLRDTATSRHAG